jgi:hypothetical protein
LLRNLQESPKSQLLFELPFCSEALEKKFHFAMWSWARLADAGEQNSGEVRRDLAGEGWGKGLGTTRARFGVLDRAVAAPARQLSGARECCRGGGCSRRGCGQCAATGGGGGSRGC